MPKIKFNYPIATVIEATLRLHLPAQPLDVVLVFDPDSISIGNITRLVSIDTGYPRQQFVAPVRIDENRIFHWTYAYKVPEGYVSVEA
jgi:hypothetical protein